MTNKIVILDDSVTLYQHYIGDDKWETVMAFPRNGLTYTIQNNGIRFFAFEDYFYRNLIISMELPLYIVDKAVGIEGEFSDIELITNILDRIFVQSDGEADLSLYLKKVEAQETYQPIGDYVTIDEIDELFDDYYTKDETDDLLDEKLDASAYTPVDLSDYYTKDESDSRFQPIGNYLSGNALNGYATESWVQNQGYINQIKTINNISLIGEGNIQIGSGGTIDAYTKAEADNRFQPKGDYVTTTTFNTYILNLTQQITSLQEAIEACCSGQTGETLYRWVTLTGPNDYICSGTTKYAKEQKQQSTDNGATWQNVSPAEYRTGSAIETQSTDCGYEPTIEYRWVTVSGDYVCSGTTKYNKEKKQYRVDGGSWIDTDPLETRRGSTVIETQSTDCGYIAPQYRWYQAPASDYMCSGTTKYYKEYYQVSTDGGNTWTNVSPTQTRQGSVIETQSTDCGYIAPQYRWQNAPNSDYICSGTTKYKKQYYQVSYDGGTTWQNVTPEQTRPGSVIETQSTDCGYIEPQYRWVNTTATTCSGYNKCYVSRQQVSYDGGSTWQNTSTTGYGTTIEEMSYDCGYVGNPKIKVRGESGSTYQVNCNSSGILTQAEVDRCLNGIPDEECTAFVEIGNCVTQIGSDSVTGRTTIHLRCMTGITIANTVTYIGRDAFENCWGLTTITLPSNLQTIESSAFLKCSGMTSIDIPASVTYIGTRAFNGCTSMQSITVRANTPPTLGGVAVFETGTGCPIYVPASKVNTYKSAWSDYASRIQAIP